MLRSAVVTAEIMSSIYNTKAIGRYIRSFLEVNLIKKSLPRVLFYRKKAVAKSHSFLF
jgi:hypothetical protein